MDVRERENSMTAPAQLGSAAERRLERALFASRWLMAPFYLGLVLALAALLVVFARELVHEWTSPRGVEG